MNFFRKTSFSKKEREERFPVCKYSKDKYLTRKIGISREKIDPMYIYSLIEEYQNTLPIQHYRSIWLENWIKLIHQELQDLSKFDLNDIDRVYIVNNEIVIFEFYLLKDVYINEDNCIIINLDNTSETPSIYGKIMTSLGFALSFGSISYLLSYFI